MRLIAANLGDAAVIMIAPFLLAAAVPATAQAWQDTNLRDYALAACLIKQDASEELKAEGYHLASLALTRANVDPAAWEPLSRVVEAAFARTGMVMVHVDGPVNQSTKPAPLASCLAVLDDSTVRNQISKLMTKGRRSEP